MPSSEEPSRGGPACRISVTVPARMARFLEDLLSSGRYGSRSEVVREGLRRIWDEHEGVQRERRSPSPAASSDGTTASGDEASRPAYLDDPTWRLISEHRGGVLQLAEETGILEVRVLLQPGGLLDRKGRLHLLVDVDWHTEEAGDFGLFGFRVKKLIGVRVWVEYEHRLIVPLGHEGMKKLKKRSILLGKRRPGASFPYAGRGFGVGASGDS